MLLKNYIKLQILYNSVVGKYCFLYLTTQKIFTVVKSDNRKDKNMNKINRVFKEIKIEVQNTQFYKMFGYELKPLMFSDGEEIFDKLVQFIKIDKDNIINYVINDKTVVEYAVYSMFKYLANQNEHKMYVHMINVEYRKFKNGDGNMFEDWTQQFYLELLKTLNNNNHVVLTDYVNQHLSKRQKQCIVNRLCNGLFESADDFTFKIISYDILSFLRSQVRKTRKVEDNYKLSYCDDLAYLKINSSLYDLESIQFFNFICSKVKINKTKKDLLLLLIDNINSTKHDFISRAADENNISSRTLREQKRVLKNTLAKSDLVDVIRVAKTFKVKAKKRLFTSRLTSSNAKKLHLNKSYLNTYRYKYADFVKSAFTQYKKQMKK